MSATDELRRLLDERGVEHYDGTERTLWGHEQTGENTGIYRFAVSEISGGFLQFDMFRITPEQAVEATLGDTDATGERQRDAVEVVRCRDCACFSVDDSDHDYRTGWWCKRWDTDMVKPDGFCAWACREGSERQEEK